MATCQALHTVELLEHILLHLPLHKILTLQRVSRAWHAIITGSVTLQTSLFLRPPAVLHQHRKFRYHYFDILGPDITAAGIDYAIKIPSNDNRFFLNPFLHTICQIHNFDSPKKAHLKPLKDDPLGKAMEFGLTLRPEINPEQLCSSWRLTRLFASRNKHMYDIHYSLSYGGCNDYSSRWHGGPPPVVARGLAPTTIGELVDQMTRLQRFHRGNKSGRATFAVYP